MRDRSATHEFVRVALVLSAAFVAVMFAADGTTAGQPGRSWAHPAGIVVASAAGWSVAACRRLFPEPGMLMALIGACLGAAYLCVPETDHIERLAIVAVLLVLAELLVRRRLPGIVQSLLPAVVVGAALFGATGRQSALVGGLYSQWPLILAAVSVSVWPMAARAHIVVRGAVAGCGVAAAMAVARTGALQPTIAPAIVAVLIATVASALVVVRIGIWVTRRSPAASH